MRVSRRRRSVPAALSAFITIIALAGASFAVALVWQNAQDSFISSGSSDSVSESSDEESEEFGLIEEDELPTNASPYIAPASASKLETGGEHIKTASEAAMDSAEKAPLEGETDAPANAGGYAREAAEGSLSAAASVDYSYFDDAIFFGDSISVGIPLYMKTLVPNAAVIAMTGVSPHTVSTSQCIELDGTRVTMLEAAAAKGERRKVYIMLGANALDLDEASFISGYKTFVQSVQQMYPDAVVYIQSMLPVTRAVNNVYKSPNVNNGLITQYNNSIRLMAKELGVYYLDVAQCMADADGYLPAEASPFDGMHLTPEYYIKWFDYLRTHTAKK